MNRKHTGFTLIELMITLVIAAIVLTIGVPSFRSILQGNRSVAQANELAAAFSTARSEALKRGKSVTVCSSSNQATCAASTNWATGWIVFMDDDNSNAFNDDGDTTLCETGEDCLVRVWHSLPSGVTLTTTVNQVRYLSTGLTTLGGDVTYALTASDCTGNNARDIVVRTTGRVHVAAAAC